MNRLNPEKDRIMQVPLEITQRDVHIPDLERERIEQKVAKLNTYYERITACRVVVEVPHQHKNKGIEYNVRIELDVPGRRLVVRRKPDADLNAAIRDAFDAARRQLEDYAREQRGDVKVHVPEPVGEVVRIFADEGYGFIESPDGDEIYFHENSLVKADFARLKVGDRVRYKEEQGVKGLQASTVKPAG
jgi:ribosomal subunit interface protein